MTRFAAIILPFLLLNSQAFAEELWKSSESWNGGEIAYPAGRPEITAIKLELESGSQVPFHCHPVPTMAFVLQGKIAVSTRAGDRRVFQRGEALVEVMSTVHRGEVLEGPLELVVFYAGSVGKPNTVLLDSVDFETHCD